MPDNPYDHIFDRHIYVSRDADNQLGTLLESFIRGRRPLRWISVQAPHGSGRTLLLERLRRLKADVTEREILRLFVNGRSSRMSALNPFAAELYVLQISDQQTVKGWVNSKIREWKRRVQNSSWRQRLTSLLFIVAGLSLTCLLVGFAEYATSTEARLDSAHGWLAFFVNYLPNNWAKFPLWFLLSSLVGLPLSLTAVYLSRNGLLPAPPEPEGPDKKQVAEFTTHTGLRTSLFELLAKRKRIVLLVDDADELPKIEEEFLLNLFAPEVRDTFQKKGWSMLFVTVDDPQHPQADREQVVHKQMHSSFNAVPVGKFELVELQAIVDSQLPEMKFDSDEERLSLLEQAQADVKALFAAQNRQLIQEIGTSFDTPDITGEFTPEKVLAYRLARRDHSITKTDLTTWLNRFTSEDQLQIFKLTLSDSNQGLVRNLAKSNLVETRGQTIVFDPERSEALRQWLKENNPRLWEQTHYYWFKTALGQISGATPATDIRGLSSDERSKLRMGTWHGLQLVAMEAVPTIITEAPAVTTADSQRLCEEAATLLTRAIVMARSEGDFEKADTLAWNALDWVRTLAPQQQATTVDWIGNQLWRNYSHSGDPVAHKKLADLAMIFPALTTTPWWRIYEAFDEWRKGKSLYAELPEEATLTDADQQNLHRLVSVLRSIKQNHGFVAGALADAAFTIPEPAAGGSDVLVEFELRALLALALHKRNESQQLVRVLGDWRQRLLVTVPPDDLLGDKAVHLYHTARYWHVLTDIYDAAGATDLQSLLLPTQTDFKVTTAALAREAENAYEQTRRLSILLGWQALLLNASFHLGVLVAQRDADENDPDKWEWDKLFLQALQLEKKLGWLIHAPMIHRIRWERVQALDQELSIEDAYNVYRSLVEGGYPIELVVEWHQRTARLLNNYGREEEDRRRSAELYEKWARTLAATSAGQKVWQYGKLQYERGYGLLFAAQAHRWLKHFDIAKSLLNEAESLLTSSPTLDEDRNDLEFRQLMLNIDLQRAWLFDAADEVIPYRQKIREIWGHLSFDDAVVTNVLGSLFGIEAAEGLLRTSWPADGHPPHQDPGNVALSLPEEWFHHEQPMRVRNRFEFRFRQLVRAIRMERNPGPRELTEAAERQWYFKEHFGQVALGFLDFASRMQHSPELEALMLNLLQAVRVYFKAEGLDRWELDALRLLMQNQATAKKYRDNYIKVLVEFESLVEREKRLRQMSEALNWPSVARWASTHLWFLIDNALLGHYLVTNNQPIDDFKPRREQLVTLLEQADEKYAEGNIPACLALLERMPFAAGQFVLIEDILALDLWLRCKQQMGDTQTDEFNLRATQLREAVIQYVQQLSAIISERQVQLLALNILSDLRQADARLRAPAQ